MARDVWACWHGICLNNSQARRWAIWALAPRLCVLGSGALVGLPPSALNAWAGECEAMRGIAEKRKGRLVRAALGSQWVGLLYQLENIASSVAFLSESVPALRWMKALISSAADKIVCHSVA